MRDYKRVLETDGDCNRLQESITKYERALETDRDCKRPPETIIETIRA